MIIKYTKYFESRLKKKLQKGPRLKTKVRKQINLLEDDVKHPGLKVHKLVGKRAEEYAFWIEGNIRITFILYPSYYLLADVITHDEY